MAEAVPVVEEFANTVKHWKMPFPELFGRLRGLTGGRVYCADQGVGERVALERREVHPLVELGRRDLGPQRPQAHRQQ